MHTCLLLKIFKIVRFKGINHGKDSLGIYEKFLIMREHYEEN